MQKLELNEPLLAGWLEKSWAVTDAQFVPVDRHADLLFEYLEQSKGSTGVFLVATADPWRGAKAKAWQAHAAGPGGIDLLRAEYVAAGVHLVLLEGRNFLLVRASPLEPSASGAPHLAQPKRFIEHLLANIVKTDTADHHWRFPLPDDLADAGPPRLITSEHAPPLKALESRHQRMDVLLCDGAVYLVFYKRIEQLEGFLPDDRWFNAAARAALVADRPTP